MDRVEFGIKIEQMEKLHKKGEDTSAAQIADGVDWRKVKKWAQLQLGAEIYEAAGRLKDARDICIYAYNRNLGGRRLVYKMTELSIAIGDMDEADDLYSEYIELAPHDSGRYVLLYELFKAKGASDEKLIEILEEFKSNELEEKFEYELAVLYAKVGRIDACVNECDDLILWFNDGDYVEKALQLKKQYAELTKSQEEKLTKMQDYREAGLEYRHPDYVQSPSEAAESVEVQPKDYSIYDTQNIQAELAKSMAAIMQDIEQSGEQDDDIWMKPAKLAKETTEAEESPAVAEEAPAVVESPVVAKEAPVVAEVAPVAAEEVDEWEEVSEEEPVRETEDDLEALDYEEPTGSMQEIFAAEPEEVAEEFDEELEDVEELEEEETAEETTEENAEKVSAVESAPEEELAVELPEEAYTDDDYEINTLAPEDEIHYVPSPHVAALLKAFDETDDWGDDTTDLAKVVSNMAGGFEEGETTEEPEEPAAPEAPKAEPETDVFFTLEPGTASTAPSMVQVVEMSVEKDDDVDEPTREIILNTHQWRRIRSEMEPLKPDVKEPEADEPAEEEAPEVEETPVVEATLPEEIPEDVEPVEQESEPAPKFLENDSDEGTPEDEPMEGQMSLLDFVANMPEVPEPVAVPEPQTPATMEEIDQAVAEVVESVDEENHLSEEEEEADEASDELTRQLQAEVFAYMNDVPAEAPAQADDSTEESEPEAEDTSETAPNAPAPETTPNVESEEAPEDDYDEEAEERAALEKFANQNFVMSDAQKKYVGRYLYMQGMENKVQEILRGKSIEKKDGTSAHGNIAILGKNDTDKEAFAINLFKAIHAGNGATNLKIAKTKAEILNHRGIDATREKLIGTTLIVEHAGKLEQRTISDLIDFMQSDTENMEVIFTGEDYAIRRLFLDYPQLDEMFDYQITLKRYTTNDLVAIATEYAREKGYRIEEKALDRLFLAINDLKSNDAGTEVAGAQKIIDDAIAKNPKKRPLRAGALIPLKAKHFARR